MILCIFLIVNKMHNRLIYLDVWSLYLNSLQCGAKSRGCCTPSCKQNCILTHAQCCLPYTEPVSWDWKSCLVFVATSKQTNMSKTLWSEKKHVTQCSSVGY